MTLDDLLALQAVGMQILDTRDPGEFAAAHLAGSINIGPSPTLAARIDNLPRTNRLRSYRRIFEGWTAQSEIASRSHRDHRAPQRAFRSGASVIPPAAACP